VNGQQDTWIKLFQSSGIGDYMVGDYRGGGGFGLVFEAIHQPSNKKVAIKVLAPWRGNAADIMEFEAEGRMLRKMAGSSNVVAIIGSAEEQLVVNPMLQLSLPIKYHVLELSAGCLDELLVDEAIRNQIPWPERILLWRDAVKGIHQMHLRNCVHRDVKGENLLVFDGKDRNYCKLSDFGRSRDLDEPARFTPESYLTGRGDIRFAPPEFLFIQGANARDALRLGDIYGLGSLLFEIGTGQAITKIALGFGPDLIRQSLIDYRAGIRADLDGLRPRYSTALGLFESELPKQIRSRAVDLVAQLCDPVPEQRLPRRRYGRRAPLGAGLEWLIVQADTLRKMLNTADSRRRYSKVGRS
jgi:eukaryotic-like serine/threonine-protein kinase